MPIPTTATVTKEPRGIGYEARLGSLYLRLAATPETSARIETAPLEPERVNTAENPEDFGNEFGARFSRSDFRGGEGLEFAHRRSQEDTSDRYYDSRNIDVARDGRISLLHSTERLSSTAATGLRAAQTETTVYWTDGTQLQSTSDDGATITAVNPHAGEVASTVADVAVLGEDIYVGVADGIHWFDASAGAWSHYVDSAGGPDRLWSVKGRILFSNGTTLYELLEPGPTVPPTLLTLPPGKTWTAVVDAGSHVLAAASDGYIYAFTFDGSRLSLAGQTYLEGEVCYSLGSSFGIVVYGTGQNVKAGGTVGRLYRAGLADGGTLADITLLKRWGDPDTETLDRRPYWLKAGRDSVFCGIRETSTEVDLWRYDLAHGGLHRSYIVPAGGASRDFLLVDGAPWTWVDGSGLWARSDSYATSGYLIGPLVDFFIADSKSWAALSVAHSDLLGDGDYLEVAYATGEDDIDDADSSGWVAIGGTRSGTLPDEMSLAGVDSRYLAVKLTITPGSTSPTVSSYTARAYPGEGDSIVILPVNVSDQIERPGRRRFTVPGFGRRVYRQLAGIEGSSTELELFVLDELWQGLVEAVQTPVTQFSWRGSSTLVSLVRFRGRRVVATTTTTEATFGEGLFGQGLFGSRETVV